MPLHNPFVPIAGSGIRYSTPSTLAVDETIIPHLPDTYDLGSPTSMWRKGYLSELDAVLFAQQTITLLGGWFYVTKDEGIVAATVLAADTSIDFGKAMTLNDFVVLRSSLQVEYVQVGALVSGTRYAVTRNLDGSGANAWPAGQPFAVFGNTGNGRIELNAYDTPRISVLEQGATYNAQTERLRLGDLAGWQSAGLTGYGWAVGDYAGNKFAYYNPTAGLIVRGDIRADAGYLGTLSISGVLSIAAAGGIYQGTGTFAAPTTGLKVWNTGGIGQLAGYNAGTLQWQVDTDGKLYAGAGAVRLGADGITIAAAASLGDLQAYKIAVGGTVYARFGAASWLGTPNTNQLALQTLSMATYDSLLDIDATAPAGQLSQVQLGAYEAGTPNLLKAYVQVNTAGGGEVRVWPTLAVGTTPAASGIIRIPNDSWITARNAANNADVNIIKVDSTNGLQIAAGLAALSSVNITGDLTMLSPIHPILSNGSYVFGLNAAVTGITIANGATATPFGAGNQVTVNGLVLITEMAGNISALFLIGGGVVLVSQITAGTFTTTKDNAGTDNFYLVAGGAYTLQNKRSGASSEFRVLAFVTRA